MKNDRVISLALNLSNKNMLIFEEKQHVIFTCV